MPSARLSCPQAFVGDAGKPPKGDALRANGRSLFANKRDQFCFDLLTAALVQPEGCVAVAGSLTTRLGLSLTQRRSLRASRAHLPPLLMLLQLMLMLLPPLHWLRVALLLLLLALQCALQMALVLAELALLLLALLLRPLLLTP